MRRPWGLHAGRAPSRARPAAPQFFFLRRSPPSRAPPPPRAKADPAPARRPRLPRRRSRHPPGAPAGDCRVVCLSTVFAAGGAGPRQKSTPRTYWIGRQIKYATRRRKKGRRTSGTAREIEASRHARRPLAGCGRTCEPPAVRRRVGAPVQISKRDAVPAARQRGKARAGVRRTASALRVDHATICGEPPGSRGTADRRCRPRPSRGAGDGSGSRCGTPAPRGARAGTGRRIRASRAPAYAADR